jgi:hypothetical protein
VVIIDLLPRHLPFLASVRGNESGSLLIVSAEAKMSDRQREIYHSENGDRWLLCRDEDGRVFVLHKANVSSGGTATKIEIGDFHGRGKAGPEHASGAEGEGEMTDDPNEEVTIEPGPHGPPRGWWTVKRNGLPARYSPDK